MVTSLLESILEIIKSLLSISNFYISLFKGSYPVIIIGLSVLICFLLIKFIYNLKSNINLAILVIFFILLVFPNTTKFFSYVLSLVKF